MNPVLPDEAVELGAVATKAFAALGGVDVARRAEADPSVRTGEVADALTALGTADIDPRADPDALAAAAALAHAAGQVALPAPVAGSLLADADGRPFAVVDDGRAGPDRAPRIDHGDLAREWRVATLDGTTGVAVPVGPPLGTRLGPFVTGVAVTPNRTRSGHVAAEVAHHLTLTAWQVLGTVEAAVALTVEHVTGRVQFGRPLSAFQAVQFQVADASVAAAGLRELAGFTLWRLTSDPDAALTDALALRVHALEVARSVLRTAQQLHGAAGVCDEYDVSVLARLVQPALRLPWGVERTTEALVAAVEQDGFDGLFPHGAAVR